MAGRVRYRKAGSQPLLWAAFFVAGNVLGIGAAVLLGPRIGAWSFAITIATVLAFIAAGFVVKAHIHRMRRVEIGRLLKKRGYTFTTAPTTESFGPFQSLIEWNGWSAPLAAGEIKWVGTTDSHLLLEREWTTGVSYDETVQEHSSTIAIVLHPNCSRAKGLRLVQERKTWKAFQDDSRDESGNPTPASIPPSINDALAASPVGEWWYFWEGWAKCSFDGMLNAQNLSMFIDHIDDVVRSL